MHERSSSDATGRCTHAEQLPRSYRLLFFGSIVPMCRTFKPVSAVSDKIRGAWGTPEKADELLTPYQRVAAAQVVHIPYSFVPRIKTLQDAGTSCTGSSPGQTYPGLAIPSFAFRPD